MFIFPVMVTEIEVKKKVKGKHSAGIDEIPDYEVKKYVAAIKNH
jgi:hypothetical protein